MDQTPANISERASESGSVQLGANVWGGVHLLEQAEEEHPLMTVSGH